MASLRCPVGGVAPERIGARLPRCAWSAGSAGSTWGALRRLEALCRGICLALALCASLGLGAWDQDRMLAAAQRVGPQALQGAQALRSALAGAGALDDEARLASVNDFFNRRIQFVDDPAVWGVADYWASPLELLGKGQGDCEDFAMAKYFSLLALGVAPSKLRLVYVRAAIGSNLSVAHMVLAYYAQANAEPLILDNLIGEIRPAQKRPDLAPVFSFNAEGLWQGTQGERAGDASARLSRWREVLAKARQEGFL